MRITVLFFSALFSLSSFGLENKFLNFGDKKFAKEKTEKSKWVLRSGIEYIKYRSVFPEYNGKQEAYEDEEFDDVFGIGLNFGREIWLGAGLSSHISIGIIYSKTLTRDVAKASEDLDLEVANTRDGHQIMSGEALISINYLFDNKTIDVQPFIEGGIGVGSAAIEKEYNREPVENANAAEDYDVKVEENFAYTKFSLGLNIISFKGISSYFKVSTMLMNITDRKTKGSSNLFGTAARVNYDTEEKNLDESVSMTTASIGLGYMF